MWTCQDQQECSVPCWAVPHQFGHAAHVCLSFSFPDELQIKATYNSFLLIVYILISVTDNFPLKCTDLSNFIFINSCVFKIYNNFHR